MKNGIIYRVISMLLASIIVLGLMSCSLIKDDYKIGEDDNGWYIKINKKFENNLEYQGAERVDIDFGSLAEMRSAFINNELTESQLSTIDRHFSKDEDGKVRLRFDLNNMYTPVIPEGFVEKWASTAGVDYGTLLSSESMNYVMFHIGDESWMMNKFDDFYYIEYQNDSYYKHETDDDRNANIYYHTSSLGKCKDIMYTIDGDNKTMYVREFYIIVADNQERYTESDTVPRYVYIYVFDENGEDYMVHIEQPSIRPSLEFISELKLEKLSEATDSTAKAPIDIITE